MKNATLDNRPVGPRRVHQFNAEREKLGEDGRGAKEEDIK
jgi:hypothetical protein